jgi:ketosteroid isomerase-like protein
MKKLILIATMACLFAATSIAQRKSANSVEKTITDLETQWSAAAKAGDADKFAALYADDLTDIDPQGKLNTKASDIADVKSGKLKFTEITNSEMKVRDYGNTAIATGVSAVKGTYDGKDISGNYRFTDVWNKRGGKWQIVATQVTKIG